MSSSAIQERHFSGGERIVGPTNFDFALFLEFGQEGTVGADLMDLMKDVGGDGGGDEFRVSGMTFVWRKLIQGGESGVDFGEQLGEVSEFGTIAGTHHRATILVAEHHDQFCAGNLGGKFHRAQLIGVRDIAGIASDEEVADALIEDALDGNARVEAGQDHCFRKLFGGRSLSAGREFTLGEGVGGIALVAIEKVGKDSLGSEVGLLLGGERKSLTVRHA